MPLSKGGLGLGCAVRARHAAHKASWADSLPMVRQRHPDVADSIIMGVERDPALCFRAVRDCEGHLRAAGFEPRPWEDIAQGARPGDSAEDEPQLQKRSWQKEATSQVEQQHLDSTVWPTLRAGACIVAFSPGTSGIHRLRGYPHQQGHTV